MATQKIKFVLSADTDPRYQIAMKQLDQFKAQGWEVSDALREEQDNQGTKVPIGVIVVTKSAN